MPVAAVAAIAVGVSVGAATIVGGLAIASGALSLAGQITGNKTLKTLGMVAGLASAGAGLIGGLGGVAEAAGSIGEGAVAGSELADGAAAAADAGSLASASTPAADVGSGLSGMDIAGDSAGLINSPTDLGELGNAAVQSPLAKDAMAAAPSPVIGSNVVPSDAPASAAQQTGSTYQTAGSSTTTGTTETIGADPPIGHPPGDNSLETAVNQESIKNPSVMSWFKNLSSAEKIQYGNMLKSGLGTVADFMGPKNAQIQAETALIKAKTGLINSQQANANNLGQLRLGVSANAGATPFTGTVQNPIRFVPKGA